MMVSATACLFGIVRAEMWDASGLATVVTRCPFDAGLDGCELMFGEASIEIGAALVDAMRVVGASIATFASAMQSARIW